MLATVGSISSNAKTKYATHTESACSHPKIKYQIVIQIRLIFDGALENAPYASQIFQQKNMLQ